MAEYIHGKLLAKPATGRPCLVPKSENFSVL